MTHSPLVPYDIVRDSVLDADQGGAKLPEHVETWLVANVPSTTPIVGRTDGQGAYDYDRPLRSMSREQERAHLWEVGQRSPSLPIGYRRKRRWSLGDLVAAYIDRLWRAHP